MSGFFVLSGMQRIGNLAPYYQWVVHLPPSSRYTWHQGGLGASSLKEVRWLKKFQAVWDSLLSANKSHFQDLTSTVSLRSGGLLSENWNSQHCHCCQRICQLHPPKQQQCTLMCPLRFATFIKTNLESEKMNGQNQILVHLLLKIAFFFSFQVYQKKVVSSCPTLWFSCFQILANKIDRSCIFGIPEIWQSKDTPKMNNPFIFSRTKNIIFVSISPKVCRSLRLTLGSPNPWPFSKTCQAKPLELLALKEGGSNRLHGWV